MNEHKEYWLFLVSLCVEFVRIGAKKFELQILLNSACVVKHALSAGYSGLRDPRKHAPKLKHAG